MDPVLLAVASAIAGKVTETVTGAGQSALGALIRLIRSRLAKDKPAIQALNHAQDSPGDQVAIQDLAKVLESIAATDADFAAQVHALWSHAQTELSARDGGVINTSTGTVSGHLIQARDLHVQGGLHLN